MGATTPETPAESLARSAAVFRMAGQDSSADFSAQMAPAAARDPGLYAHWARQQAERATRFINSTGAI